MTPQVAPSPLPTGALLAVHAHPDDETLSTGALLAAWARSGEPVTVVTCTRGERGEVIDTPHHPTGLAHLEGDPRALAAHREQEVAAALDALGVGDQVFLDTVAAGRPAATFEDSGMQWVAPGVAGPAADAPATALSSVALDDAAIRLAAVVRDRRPGVVVSYEARGGYGHPDHVRTHEATVRALELAADPTANVPGESWHVPERWEAVAPAGEVRAARRTLADDAAARRLAHDVGLSFPAPDEPLPPVAKDAAELAGADTVRVPVAPVLGAVLAAMRAHATQVQHATASGTAPGEPSDGLLGWYALSNDVLAPVLEHETYTRRPAPVGSPR